MIVSAACRDLQPPRRRSDLFDMPAPLRAGLPAPLQHRQDPLTRVRNRRAMTPRSHREKRAPTDPTAPPLRAHGLRFAWHAHGLRFVSDLLLPPFHGAHPRPTPSAHEADVNITASLTPLCLPDPHETKGLWQLGDRDAIFTLDSVGQMRVTDGCRVTYRLEATADAHDLAALFWVTVLPMLLAQRGIICLRGTALADEHGAVVLVGLSGAGKTTIGLGLLARGLQLVSDGVVSLAPDRSGGWMVLPGLPAVRVWPRALATCERSDAHPIPLRRNVRCGWLPTDVVGDAVPLRRVVKVVADARETPGLASALRDMRACEALLESALPLTAPTRAHAARLLSALSGVVGDVPVREIGRIEQDVAKTLALIDAPASPIPPPAGTRRRTASRTTHATAQTREGYFLLASYPKSGNTWMRILLSHVLSDDDPIDINRLLVSQSMTGRALLDAVQGVESAVLTEREIIALRSSLLHQLPLPALPLRFAKVHDAGPFRHRKENPYPPDSVAGVIYLTRNPLDVAVSYAHHRGTDIDETISIMADPRNTLASQEGMFYLQLPQPLDTWSEHVRSWLDSDLPLIMIRYEDMLADPATQLHRVIDFAGLQVDPERIARAADAARFDRLQTQERERGFRERGYRARSFFREGRAGAWRDHLTPAQVERIIADHGSAMARLGYLPLDPAPSETST